LFISAHGDGGKSTCFEVDLYERTSSPMKPFVLITARCRRPRFMSVIDGRDGSGEPGWASSESGGTQHPATSALVAADSPQSVPCAIDVGIVTS